MNNFNKLYYIESLINIFNNNIINNINNNKLLELIFLLRDTKTQLKFNLVYDEIINIVKNNSINCLIEDKYNYYFPIKKEYNNLYIYIIYYYLYDYNKLNNYLSFYYNEKFKNIINKKIIVDIKNKYQLLLYLSLKETNLTDDEFNNISFIIKNYNFNSFKYFNNNYLDCFIFKESIYDKILNFEENFNLEYYNKINSDEKILINNIISKYKYNYILYLINNSDYFLKLKNKINNNLLNSLLDEYIYDSNQYNNQLEIIKNLLSLIILNSKDISRNLSIDDLKLIIEKYLFNDFLILNNNNYNNNSNKFKLININFNDIFEYNKNLDNLYLLIESFNNSKQFDNYLSEENINNIIFKY